MLRIHVSTAGSELMLGDTVKAALRSARYTVVDALEAAPHVVVAIVDGVDESCRLVSSIVSRQPLSVVVALGNRCSEEAIVALIESGAKGYVDRTQRFTQLVVMIEAVSRGRVPVSGRITARAIQKIERLSGQLGPRVPPADLTQREQVILELIGQGCTNKDIANKLTISINTVKNHVQRILDKLQVRGRRDAARSALSIRGRVATAP